MLRTAQSLPPTGLSTLGFCPARFQTEPPACYRASWQLPGRDSHPLAATSLCPDQVTPSTTSESLGTRRSSRRRRRWAQRTFFSQSSSAIWRDSLAVAEPRSFRFSKGFGPTKWRLGGVGGARQAEGARRREVGLSKARVQGAGNPRFAGITRARSGI